MTGELLLTRTDRRPVSACRLYLVRHGTTRLNAENRYRGRRDIPLDAHGYKDAVEAALRLSSVGLTAVYAGPLRRTIATAHIVADAAGVPDVRILHGLNNIDYGTWEGMTAEEATMYDPEAYALYRTSPHKAVCPQGERLSDAQRRMLAALQLIGSRHPGEAVAAVTHAVMIRLAVVELNGVEGESWRRPVGGGSVTEFHIEDRRIRLSTLPKQNGSAVRSARSPSQPTRRRTMPG